MHEGWPDSGSLAGIFNATLLFVMSFLYVTFGRTKMLMAAATIVLGLWVASPKTTAKTTPAPRTATATSAS
jgi:hypothetical protein